MTSLGICVLALLNERPMHPYEMYRLLLERHEDRIVKVRPGSLYHTVARLAERGLVEATGTEREGGRPERTTYRINVAGRDALAERIRTVLRTPVNEYPQFPVALAEAHNLPRGEVIELLRARANHVEATVTETADLLAVAHEQQIVEAYLLAGRYVHAMLTTELGWLRSLLDRLERKELPWPHDDTG
jgi:DNA-binding PadR family transcriptional regulator